MTERLRVVSPVDGSVYLDGEFHTDGELATAVTAARRAAPGWRRLPAADRLVAVEAFLQAFAAEREDVAAMVAWQIGRPLAQADEVDTLQYLMAYYKDTLSGFAVDMPLPSDEHDQRFVTREPYGLCLSICAWNYPVAMMAGQILAPLLVGNVVIFKHSPQAARLSEVVRRAARTAGLPEGVLQAVNLTNAQADGLLRSGAIDLVNFIGSVGGGRQVRQSAAGGFTQEILELGGKDAAYVRSDADIDWAASELVTSSFGNSGQSCCSTERIYVDAAVYDRFVEAFCSHAGRLTIGHPFEGAYDLGPVVSAASASRINAEVDAAVRAGAREILGLAPPSALIGGAYVTPKVLVDVTQDMAIMREETFGPVAPIMRVGSEDEALRLINDSDYGLTASIWTADAQAGLALGRRIDTGCFYVNRADYVDEHLPWNGVKASGLGYVDGYAWGDSLTRAKGYYARSRSRPESLR